MSLIGALNIGKSALAVSQAALQTTGNNIANAGNTDYTRQVGHVSANRDQQLRPGVFIGTGINLDSIERQIDEALQGRLRGSVSDNEAADTVQQWLGRVEAVFNELSDQDLSTQLSQFFNSWSNLANKPQDTGLRQVVLQNGASVAAWLRDTRSKLDGLQKDVDDRLGALAIDADGLAQKVADLNQQIILAEGGTGGVANGLRDQRDAVLKQLAQLMDVKTIEDKGVVNVFVGSEPLVLGTTNRGVALKLEVVDGKQVGSIIFRADNGTMNVTGGQIGGLMDVRGQIGSVIDQVDEQAAALIYELNKLHSSGQGLAGLNSVRAEHLVDDVNEALNTDDAGLPFTPTNGSFVVHVKQKNSGLVTSTLVQVDLDGLNSNDATLTSLATDLDGIADISAVATASGELQITTDSADVEISFSQDSSGVLAALGINSFFAGKNAIDIEVNTALRERPSLLAAARNGQPADNQTALAIAALESKALSQFDDSSLKSAYQSMINGVSVGAASAKTNAEATRVVKETLESQREALSGVSLDEEALNLMKQQRAYQGAAKLITAINELMDTMLAMV